MLRTLLDEESHTLTHLLVDPATQKAALIDPVLEQVDRDLRLIDELQVELQWVLETHVHADHVTAAQALRRRTGARVGVGRATEVAAADHHFDDGELFKVGNFVLKAIATPGHTSGCTSYFLPEGPDGPAIFTGDALMVRGCGRTDFQSGDAATLYRSIHNKVFTLPPQTRVYPAHDYRGFGETTVGEEIRLNSRLGQERTQEDFVRIMDSLNLAPPKRIKTAVAANLKLGGEDHALRYTVRHDGVAEVTPADVRAAKEDLRLIDIREPDECDGPLHALDNAERIPVGQLPKACTTWPKDERVVLVCRSGRRSANACLELQALGFNNTASLAGGMLAWEAS